MSKYVRNYLIIFLHVIVVVVAAVAVLPTLALLLLLMLLLSLSSLWWLMNLGDAVVVDALLIIDDSYC